MYSLMLLGALAGSVMSQAISFSNTTFTAPVAVGDMWSISFAKGTGDDVAIAFGNSTYAFQIVDGLSAPGMYSWKVAVPVNVVAGVYQLALLQGDEDPVFSPGFTFTIPTAVSSMTTNAPTTDLPFPTIAAGAGAISTATTTATTTVTAIYLNTPTGLALAPNMTNATMPMPIQELITYIYWEDSCACHQTSSCPASALPTSMSTTTVTYSEKNCGCTKTVEAPCAETAIPVPVTPTAMPVPAMSMSSSMPVAAVTSSSMTSATTTAAPVSSVAPMASIPPMTFTGAAERVVASGFAFLAVVGALVLA